MNMSDFYSPELLAALKKAASADKEIDEAELDPVHPNHYKLPGGMQVIDVEMAMFGKQAVMDHCICTAVEYLLRHRRKNGVEDVKKAGWWVQHYLELAEEEDA